MSNSNSHLLINYLKDYWKGLVVIPTLIFTLAVFFHISTVAATENDYYQQTSPTEDTEYCSSGYGYVREDNNCIKLSSPVEKYGILKNSYGYSRVGFGLDANASGIGWEIRGILEFDLSDLPDGHEIDEVEIHSIIRFNSTPHYIGYSAVPDYDPSNLQNSFQPSTHRAYVSSREEVASLNQNAIDDLSSKINDDLFVVRLNGGMVIPDPIAMTSIILKTEYALDVYDFIAPEGVTVVDDRDTLPLERSIVRGTTTLKLYKGSVHIVDIPITAISNIDWSLVNIGTDESTGKSLFHIEGGYQELIGSNSSASGYSLYIPMSDGDNQVTVCPGAESYDDITESCDGAIVFTEEAPNVSIVIENSKSYWKIDGLTGTGAVSGAVNLSETGSNLLLTVTASLLSLMVITIFTKKNGLHK